MATILLVSDNLPALEMVRSALVTAGHDVMVAPDTTAVSRRRFDLAIVDFARSDSAVEARELAGKVVLFSEATEEATRARVEEVGAQGYVRKLGPERLREDVSHLLG